VVAEVKRNEEGSKAGMGAEWKILAGRGGRSELATGPVVRRSERPGARWSPTSERERERKRASLTIRVKKGLEPNKFCKRDASRESRAYDSAFNPLSGHVKARASYRRLHRFDDDPSTFGFDFDLEWIASMGKEFRESKVMALVSPT